ncbi:hypothetical protein C8R43DRAFT_1245339 [Mycena crocata]|nr:hypothetical protein C8R43DRAFT_1245339 [Mycena crocata]
MSYSKSINDAIQSSSFSLGSPAVAHDVWTSVQDAPNAVCEEFVLLGDHVLRKSYLAFPKRSVARPNGFYTTVRDLILSPDVYSAFVARSGVHWRGPNSLPAAEAFLIFVAALDISLDPREVLNWFGETFGPLIKAIEESYEISSRCPSTNQADAATMASKHCRPCFPFSLKGEQRDWTPLSILTPFQLIWSASSSAAARTGTAIGPVIRLAGNTLRGSLPLKWIRAQKLKDTLGRAKTRRRVSSILDPRPPIFSQVPNSAAICTTTEITTTPAFASPSTSPRLRSDATIMPPPTPSNIRPFRYYIASTQRKEVPPTPTPLRLPRNPGYGLRENIWNETEHGFF